MKRSDLPAKNPPSSHRLAEKLPDEKDRPGLQRITPAMAERLQQDFNVILPNPKLGDINAQFNEALPEAHGLIGVGRKLGRAQLEARPGWR